MEDKKAEIFNCGKELFSTKGFKDTNVSDITKMAGVAVGTFYKYFPSKEKLFIEIYKKENEKLKESFGEVLNLDDDPVNLVKQMLFLNLKGMSSNPILKEWYNKDFFDKLEKEFYEQGGLESAEVNNILGLIKKWKAEGKIRNDLDDEFIGAMIKSLYYVEIHKKEIGFQFFPQLMDYLAEFIMKGLTNP
jgi:AcrR family transcriptional regulator